MVFEDIKNDIKRRVRERINLNYETTDEEVANCITETLLEDDRIRLLDVENRVRIKDDIFNSMRRLDAIQPFIEDDEVTEIMINGQDNIFVEKNGAVYETGIKFESKERLNDVIQTIVASCNRVVNEASPIVDARLKTGERVNIVMYPVALNGPIVTIRRFPDTPITMEQLIKWKTITKEAAEFLKALVKAKYNIVISGGTASGKSTFLNVLSEYINDDERVITIEDNAELKLQGIKNLVSLETRNANVEGMTEISIRDLIKSSLRMRPDRLIVGEVRGAEAIDMLQCMNTGHDGSMSTGHANSAEEMLYRLENMVMMGMDIPLEAIRRQITSAVDILIHLERSVDKKRKVVDISEIIGYIGGEIRLNKIFEEKNGELVHVGELQRKEKLKKAKKRK